MMLASYLILYQGIMDALWFLKKVGGNEKSESSIKKEEPVVKDVYYL
ncbi:MAG: hypothetical protein R2788_12730 [Saprospiraceae bacterium]